MDGHVKLIVGCVVLIPSIIALVASAWKYWRGEWLRLATGWTFAPDEKPDSPYCRRRAKRIALLNLVLAAMFAGQLALLAVDQLGGAPASGQTWPFAVLSICVVGGGVWILAASRRDARSIAAGASGTAPGLSEGYAFGRRHAAVLVAIMIAVVALEIALFVLER